MRLFRWVFLARSRRSICRGLMDRSCRSVAALSRNRFASTASRSATAPSAAPTTGNRPLPKRPSGWTVFPGHSAAHVAAPAQRAAFLGADRSEAESRISGGSRVETEFVQDHMFYPVPRLAVTLIDGSQVLPFRLMAHRNPPQKPSELGYILNGAITPSRVTF